MKNSPKPSPVALRDLLREARLEAAGVGNEMVEGLDYDSRRIGKGYLFFAFAGARSAGAGFAHDALQQGALGVVSESEAPPDFRGLWIRVPHGRQALALMARRFYPEVGRRVNVTGVTGTNGKTTTCCLIDTILRTAGHETALVGTIGYHVAGVTRPALNTTPESLDLYRLYQELVERGGTMATMEVSSHALALGRVHGMRFHTAVFTNLTQDHLDFHRGGMEDYFAAKRRLFAPEEGPPPRWAVVNVDDPWSERIPRIAGTEWIPYGLGAGAGLRAERIEAGFAGLRFDVLWEGRRWPVVSKLAGRINACNILAAFGAGLCHGVEPEKIVEGIAAREAVAGRFERIDEGQPFLVLVDYAHTDAALRNVLEAARELTRSRVVTVFGCGGDRDRTKRPLMGQAAGERSDFVVLTSDNPRGENPLAIMNDALVGLRRTSTPHRLEPDREEAIRAAITGARAGDVVVIAGKGHEAVQVMAAGSVVFDDREVARRVLTELGFSGRAA